jgi:hypothetical protein
MSNSKEVEMHRCYGWLKRVSNKEEGLNMVELDGGTTMLGDREVRPAGLFAVAWCSRKSKTVPLIMMVSFSLMTLTRMEVAVADPTVTRRVLQVEHVKIESTKTFAEVAAALDSTVPQLDPAIIAALAKGDEQHAKEVERGSKLFIFLKRDHGGILQITGRPRKALQYEIGNPLTATGMTRLQLPAALYAPLRVVLYENASGGATFEYDKPSTLFGLFGTEQVTAVGRELDDELERALRQAAE